MEGETLILIDTSSWIEALRKDGDEKVRLRVKACIEEGKAAFCDIVLLELWCGAKGAYEKKVLENYENNIASLAITSVVWQLSKTLARKSKAKGYTLPATDILIAACAFYYKVQLEYCDRHFDMLEEFRDLQG